MQVAVEGGETAYMKARSRLPATPDIDLNKKIEEMVAEGLSMSELEMMFPSVPVTAIREIFEQFQDA
ncbi:hypothetical protein [Roseococcus sp.]|uniref:hypothetical protein n=1 Tax=Roseococcus sp. TaxID=2109646 RepID=UPI003BA9C84F